MFCTAHPSLASLFLGEAFSDTLFKITDHSHCPWYYPVLLHPLFVSVEHAILNTLKFTFMFCLLFISPIKMLAFWRPWFLSVNGLALMTYLLMFPSHLDRHVAHSRPSISTCWVRSSVTKLWVSSTWCFVSVVPFLGWESLIMLPHTLCLSFQSDWKWLMGNAQILFESFFFFFNLSLPPTFYLELLEFTKGRHYKER